MRDLRHARRLAHLVVEGVPAAVADVVADRVVEEHGVLRDDADRRAEALLRDVADVLSVDQDAPARHVIEAERSREIVDFPAPEGPTIATLRSPAPRN